MSGETIAVRVVAAEAITPTIKRLRMVARDGARLPPYSAGSHTVLTMASGERVIRNAYSLLGSTLAGGAYEVAVLRAPRSRGGSAFVHDHVGEGHELTLSVPINLFPLNRRARHHVLVAGGIGITPIGAMADELAKVNASFELHYAVRNEARGAFCGDLAGRYGERVRLYVSERQERLHVHDILMRQPLGTHLYVCGPEGMIGNVLADARALGWPETSLHAERFLAAAGGAPFALRLAKSGVATTVGEDQTLLEAIEAAGIEAPFSCRGGVCGECELPVVSADGEIDHRDHYLSAEEKAAGCKIMPCVSRLRGRELVLDL
ncbi:PDR/VanB family oxidoreductase [Jiella sonneratiae]|uniref:Oxidoreductase n=1 Tax=Jiella sonneratiae TaxID=2816856 RepID=A0ABS3J9S8_9HYPH|nr:PDR/VanB family oxidoreductase [Jiella sonneratiae]MBO0906410.1 oxidoreductase [Jiella sonneratiae]